MRLQDNKCEKNYIKIKTTHNPLWTSLLFNVGVVHFSNFEQVITKEVLWMYTGNAGWEMRGVTLVYVII